MNAPLETVLADFRARLKALYGPRLERVILFGSRARGDAEPDSDIDVMIVLKQRVEDRGAERERYMNVAADLSLKYDAVIMPFLTDMRTLAASDFSLFENVRREGVAV
jgi:predicted nucleotidyltransferase